MTRANIAAFKSRTLALIDTLHLSPGEVVELGLQLAASHSAKAGLDRQGLQALLDDGLARLSVEGGAS
jgi:hypothetical protein